MPLLPADVSHSPFNPRQTLSGGLTWHWQAADPLGWPLLNDLHPSIPEYPPEPREMCFFAHQTLAGQGSSSRPPLLSLHSQGFRWCFRQESNIHPLPNSRTCLRKGKSLHTKPALPAPASPHTSLELSASQSWFGLYLFLVLHSYLQMWGAGHLRYAIWGLST